MRQPFLPALLVVLCASSLAAQPPDYSSLEQRSRSRESGKAAAAQPQMETSQARQLAYRLFDAQWPENKSPGAEWRRTAKEEGWFEWTCLYSLLPVSEFGFTRYKAQRIRVYVNPDGSPIRAEFRQISSKERSSLENFYPQPR